MENRGSEYLQSALVHAAKFVCNWKPTFAAYLEKKRSEVKHYYVALSHAAKNLFVCSIILNLTERNTSLFMFDSLLSLSWKLYTKPAGAAYPWPNEEFRCYNFFDGDAGLFVLLSPSPSLPFPADECCLSRAVYLFCKTFIFALDN